MHSIFKWCKPTHCCRSYSYFDRPKNQSQNSKPNHKILKVFSYVTPIITGCNETENKQRQDSYTLICRVCFICKNMVNQPCYICQQKHIELGVLHTMRFFSQHYMYHRDKNEQSANNVNARIKVYKKITALSHEQDKN